MSTREKVLKLAELAGFGTRTFNVIDGPEVVDSDYVIITNELERFYQAAYLAGAKAMQEEAEKKCDQYKRGLIDLVNVRELQYAIRAIRPENLGGA